MPKTEYPKSSSRRAQEAEKSIGNQPPKSVVHVFEDKLPRWGGDYAEIARKLCELLQIPDLASRSGLKQVHLKLPLITKRLDDVLRFSRRPGYTGIAIGVVAIYSKMCTLDAVLQEKLLSNGLYSNLVDLSKEEGIRESALKALSFISCRTGTTPKVSHHFLRCSPALLELALDHSEDPGAMSSLAHIFSHTAAKAEHMRSKIDITLLGRTLLEAIKKPDALPGTFGDACACFQSESYQLWERLEDLPGFLTLHVALLRSKQLELRAMALRVIFKVLEFQVNPVDSNEVLAKSDPEASYPAECIGTPTLARDLKIANLPITLRKRLQAYGKESTVIVSLQRARAAYMNAFLDYPPEADLRSLGRELAEIIFQEQYTVPELIDPVDGMVVQPCRTCSNEQKWVDVLEDCVQALDSEESNTRWEDQLSQAILVWKIRTRTCPSQCFFDCCKELTDMWPCCPLFYYVPDRHTMKNLRPEDLLRLAKKGLACCENIPRWLRFELLGQACESAFYAGMQRVGDRHAEEGSAFWFLSSARTDAKTIIDEGSPDGLRRATVLSLYVLTALILDGPKCDFNDPYMKHVLDEVKINKQLRKLMGCPVPEEYEEFVFPHTFIQRLMPQAMEEWGDVVQRMDGLSEGDRHGDEAAVDDALTQWLNAFDTGEEEEEAHRRSAKVSVLHTRTGKEVALKVCSWCGGPSAALKQCSGCGNARYCDAECQKLHWKKHKAECRPSDKKRVTEEDS